MACRKTTDYKLQHNPVGEEDIDVNKESDEVGEFGIALRKVAKFVTTKTLRMKQVERLIEVAEASDSASRDEVSLSCASCFASDVGCYSLRSNLRISKFIHRSSL